MTYDDGDEDRDDDDDREAYVERMDAEHERWKCVLGEHCLVADPFHSSDECFDAEWADAYFAEQALGPDVDDSTQVDVIPEPVPGDAEDDLLLS